MPGYSSFNGLCYSKPTPSLKPVRNPSRGNNVSLCAIQSFRAASASSRLLTSLHRRVDYQRHPHSRAPLPSHSIHLPASTYFLHCTQSHPHNITDASPHASSRVSTICPFRKLNPPREGLPRGHLHPKNNRNPRLTLSQEASLLQWRLLATAKGLLKPVLCKALCPSTGTARRSTDSEPADEYFCSISRHFCCCCCCMYVTENAPSS